MGYLLPSPPPPPAVSAQRPRPGRWLLLALALLLGPALTTHAQAPCVTATYTTGGTTAQAPFYNVYQQSFTATCSGQLTTMVFNFPNTADDLRRSGYSVKASLTDAAGTTVLATLPFDDNVIPLQTRTYDFSAANVFLTSGTQYRWELRQIDNTIGATDPAVPLLLLQSFAGNPYTGGQAFSAAPVGASSPAPAADRDFRGWTVNLGPAVQTGAISGSPFCAGGAVSVPFTASGTIGAGNVYTAQLSNASGSFAAPVSIGTLSSTASTGTISATVPAGTASGTGYRIRVTASTAGLAPIPNTSNLTVNGTAAPTGSASQSFAAGATVANLTATGTAIKWYATSSSTTALASTTALVNGTIYYATQTVSGFESCNRFAVTATVSTPNQPPTIANQTRSIAENAATGTNVGLPIAASDPDAAQTLTYAITGGNPDNAFAINPTTGQLTVGVSAGGLDFETTPTYALTVRVTDNAATPASSSATITVNVIDVSEAPVVVPGQTRSIAENAAIGTNVGLAVAASDPDAGQTLTYAIISGNTGGAFAINASTGQLTVAGLLDFETTASYTLTVRVRDNAGTPLSGSANVTVNLTNVNEAPTYANLGVSVAEDTPIGTVVSSQPAFDPEGAPLTYAITGGNTGGAFAINPTTGVITVAGLLDAEGLTTDYFLAIQVSDGTLTGTGTRSFFVFNINEPPTALTLSPTTVAENTGANVVVGILTAADPEVDYVPSGPRPGRRGGSPPSVSFSLVSGIGSADNALVNINGKELRITASPNFEAKSSYAVRVRATDQDGLFIEENFVLTVTNVNEAPTALALSNATIAENTGANVTVGQLLATDPDAGATFTYTLVSGVGSNDNALVNISGGDNLRLTADPDFETKSSYVIRVRATDQGGLSFDRILIITITDVLETPANDAPVNIFLSNADVAENAPNAVVGLLTTADGDVADTHTYTLVSGTGSTGNGAFTIVGDQLRVGATALDFEAQSSYSVRIRTTDSGAGNLAFTKVFTITVLDVAEDLTISTGTPASPVFVPGGLYNNITVTNTGVASLTGVVVVNGAFVVQSGGTLYTRCLVTTGPGSFTLADEATLVICNEDGISALPATTGGVQVTGGRSFSSGARYVYFSDFAQQTGTGLPATVRSLQMSNDGAGLTLTQPVAITEELRLSAGTLVTGGNTLTLLSTAARTAYALHEGGDVSGNVTVQRYVGGPAALSYHHLSSPVQGAPVSDLATSGFVPKVNPAYNALPYVAPPTASFPNVFGFDETRGGTTPAYAAFNTGYFSPATLGTPLAVGRGYSVYIGGQKTPDFVGALTTGNVNVPLSVTGLNTSPNAQKAGWHLLGNPYPQPIDWDLLATPAGLNASVSVWYSTGGVSGAYRTRNASGVGSLTDGLIGVGQAFFVRATSATAFPFTNALRVEEGAVALGRAAVGTAAPLLTLTLTKVGAAPAQADELFLYPEAGAGESFDAAFDAARPGRNVGLPTLSALIDGQEAVIDARNPAEWAAGQFIELVAAVPAAGVYTLQVGTLAHLAADRLVLRDRLTGTAYDLHQRPTLAFTAAQAGELRGRFAVEVNLGRVTGLTPALTAPKLALWPNPATSGTATVRLTVPGGVDATAPVTVLDAAGRVVRRTVLSAESALDVRGLPAGVYAVRCAGATARLVVE